MENTLIRGFVTNLGKYNEGYLIGEWVDFPISDEEMQEVFERIGINEEYEEYFFTDWESDLQGFGEYENIEHINEIAEELEALDDYEVEKLKAILEVNGGTLEEALENIDNYDFYQDVTLEDVAYDLVEECYNLPEIAKRYFNYEAFARDLSFDGYTETQSGVLVTC